MSSFDYDLSVAELESYSRDGVIPLRGVVDGALLGRLQTAADRASSRPGGFWYNIYLWRDDPDFRFCCMNSGLPGIAAQLLQSSKVNLLYDQLFIKPPEGEPTPWHHDLPYWPVQGTSVTSLWLALSEVSLHNGGLEFIRGSHRWRRQHRTFTVDYQSGEYSDAVRSPGDGSIPDYEQERGNYEILHWDLNPGDAVAFHALTFHYAPGNSSTDCVRKGYAMRFMGSEVRYKEMDGMNRRVFNPDLAQDDVMDSEQYPVVFPSPSRSPPDSEARA